MNENEAVTYRHTPPGPSSVGADVRLHGFSHLYGLPEHADSLQLKDTR